MERKDKRGPLVIAHGGCRYPGYNQNTVRAYEKAFEEGAKAFEFDVQTTRDGSLVVVHNLYLDKVSTGTGPVCEATAKTIDGLWAGSPANGKDRIPYLGEIIDLMASYPEDGRPVMHLELKGTGAGTPVGKAVKKAVDGKRIRMQDILVSSFNWDELRLCSLQCPDIPLALLAGAFTYDELVRRLPGCSDSYFSVFGNLSERYLQPQKPTLAENKSVIDAACPDPDVRSVLYEFAERALDGSFYDEELLRTAKELGARAVNLWHRSATVGFMKEAQNRGLKVQLYTVNDPDEIRMWTEAGVDGIFTDSYGRTQAIVDAVPR